MGLKIQKLLQLQVVRKNNKKKKKKKKKKTSAGVTGTSMTLARCSDFRFYASEKLL